MIMTKFQPSQSVQSGRRELCESHHGVEAESFAVWQIRIGTISAPFWYAYVNERCGKTELVTPYEALQRERELQLIDWA